MAFGAVIFAQVCLYFQRGWIESQFIKPVFLFKYLGFEWVRPWPGVGMYVHFAAMGILALFVAVGFLYRLSAVLLFYSYAYYFLLEQTTYQNHLYLILLTTFLFAVMSPHRVFSIDAWLWPRKSQTVPSWQLHLLRAQYAIPYFFSGLAKWNSDWLHGLPLKIWFADRTAIPILGHLLAQPWAAYLFSYGGLAIDLSLPFLLYCRRTRLLGLGVAVFFSAMNWILWDIDVFPALLIAATSLYFSPDWPRRFLHRANVSGDARCASPLSFRRKLATCGLAIYVAIQIAVPLRRWLYPGGDVSWTRRGQTFAWLMKLDDEEAVLHLFADDPATHVRRQIHYELLLTEDQTYLFKYEPDMLVQFCHFFAAQMKKLGKPPMEIHADDTVSLNGHPAQRLIDPNVDLAVQSRGLGPYPWVLSRRR